MKTLFILILFFANIIAQDESILKHFPGQWKLQTDKQEMFEEWTLINDNELACVNYRINGTEKEIVENVTLKKFADYWAYVAIPAGHTPTLFTLVEHTDDKFIFENKEHDFPQRIIYEFHPDGKLNAAIEGNTGGEFKRKDYFFMKTD
jgi:hypothetical protein